MFDGSMRPNLGSIATRGVFRDDKHNWLCGFVLNKGVGTPLKAKLRGGGV